jgi:hypothetical protein
MRALGRVLSVIFIVLCTSMAAFADEDYQSCGMLYEGNPPTSCITVVGSSQKATLENTWYHTVVKNDCSIPVKMSVDYGSEVGHPTINSGTTTLICEDTPLCHSAHPYSYSSGCCNRPPVVQSCSFAGKKKDQQTKTEDPKPAKNAGGSSTRNVVITHTAHLPERDIGTAPEPDFKLTEKEKSLLSSCYGDIECINSVMTDAKARNAKDQKDAKAKEQREEKEFSEFVKKETARRQAKIDEEERMRKYHEEQNAAVATQFFNGAAQILQGYVNSQSAGGGNGNSGGGTYNGKSLTTPSGGGSDQCGVGCR